ncbi:hypothetical protein PROFUN_17059, partial [Planoprotostelium fungivorum]
KPRNAAANTLCSIGHGVKKPPQQINHAGVVTADNIRKVKYDISPPITKTNSYMKLEYGAYAFLDAHNYVPPTTNLEKFGIMWGKHLCHQLSVFITNLRILCLQRLNMGMLVHEFISFKLNFKLAKSQQDGCKGYAVEAGLKNKRCLKPPDLKDNLCFWRCIAIALYESSCQGIQQVNSKQQREKAIALRDQYYSQCGQNTTDHVQVAVSLISVKHSI